MYANPTSGLYIQRQEFTDNLRKSLLEEMYMKKRRKYLEEFEKASGTPHKDAHKQESGSMEAEGIKRVDLFVTISLRPYMKQLSC
jgi:hypothetical protein